VRGSESAQMNYGFGKGEDKDGGECGREVAGGGRATVASPLLHRRTLPGTRSHGPSWATGNRALPLKLFPKFQNQHKLCNPNW
jgi:hypothetical protein